jgi:serine/threonine protein kinase
MAKCPKCSKEFSENTVGGFCPACLLQQGLESQAGVTAGPAAATLADPGSDRDAQRTMSSERLMSLLPQFDQIELIGRGGMGVVYKARQKNLDRLVALKVLSPAVAGSPGFAERFAREARAMARLNHPNIVAVHDFGCVDNSGVELCYFSMEFVDGSNLRGLIKQLTPSQALAIVPQICEALQYAHDIGIIHRDIKPENILIDKKGRVKIADFGLAKLLQQARSPSDYTLTRAELVMGTPSYMAPEQMERPTEVDHRADLYSLGVVFYEMLTGQLPTGRFPLPSQRVQIDVRFDEVVLKALEHDRELRYQHASEVQTSVESVRSSMQPLPTPVAQPASAPDSTPVIDYAAAPTPARRLSRVAILASLFLIAGLFAMGVDGFMIVANKAQGFTISRQDWTVFIAVLVVPLIAGFATTLLGTIAVVQIRSAPEKLYGFRLALFDALLCPLLLLDVVVVGLVEVILAAHYGAGQAGVSLSFAPLFFLLPLAAVLIDPLVYWWLWKKLRVQNPAQRRGGVSSFPLALKILAVMSVATFIVSIVCYFTHAADITTVLIVGTALGVTFTVANQSHNQKQISRARDLGLWPALGEVPTQEHIKRLAQAGETILAIKLCRQMGAGLAEARSIVAKDASPRPVAVKTSASPTPVESVRNAAAQQPAALARIGWRGKILISICLAAFGFESLMMILGPSIPVCATIFWMSAGTLLGTAGIVILLGTALAIFLEWWASPSSLALKLIRTSLLLLIAICSGWFCATNVKYPSAGAVEFSAGAFSSWLQIRTQPFGWQVVFASWSWGVFAVGWMGLYGLIQSYKPGTSRREPPSAVPLSSEKASPAAPADPILRPGRHVDEGTSRISPGVFRLALCLLAVLLLFAGCLYSGKFSSTGGWLSIGKPTPWYEVKWGTEGNGFAIHWFRFSFACVFASVLLFVRAALVKSVQSSPGPSAAPTSRERASSTEQTKTVGHELPPGQTAPLKPRFRIWYLLLSTVIFTAAFFAALTLWNLRWAGVVLGGGVMFVALIVMIMLGHGFRVLLAHWRTNTPIKAFARFAFSIVFCIGGYYFLLGTTVGGIENHFLIHGDSATFENEYKGKEYQLVRMLPTYKESIPQVELVSADSRQSLGGPLFPCFGNGAPVFGQFAVEYRAVLGFWLMSGAVVLLFTGRDRMLRPATWRVWIWPATLILATIAGWFAFDGLMSGLMSPLVFGGELASDAVVKVPLNDVQRQFSGFLASHGYVPGDMAIYWMNRVPDGKQIGAAGFENFVRPSPFDRWHWRGGALFKTTPLITFQYATTAWTPPNSFNVPVDPQAPSAETWVQWQINGNTPPPGFSSLLDFSEQLRATAQAAEKFAPTTGP